MAIVSPLLMCMSFAVCSAPIVAPNTAQDDDTSMAMKKSKIILPFATTRNLSIEQKKPIADIMRFPINRDEERPILNKPAPLPVFTTEIELTPTSWPLRGTFNPLGMKLKLHMTL